LLKTESHPSPPADAETIRLLLGETNTIRAAKESSLIFMRARYQGPAAASHLFLRKYQNVLGILLTFEAANVIFPCFNSFFCTMLNHTSIENASAECVAEERLALTGAPCSGSYRPAVDTIAFPQSAAVSWQPALIRSRTMSLAGKRIAARHASNFLEFFTRFFGLLQEEL
jgi:hypothetical protein